MLILNVVLDQPSSFTGTVTVVFNCGGVRAVKAEGRSLKVVKADSVQPVSILDRPRST